MKKLLKGLMTITMIFIFAVALTGCGKEETPTNGETTGGNDNQNDNENNDNNVIIKLESDDTKYVINYMDVYYIIYYHDGETITGLEYVYMYPSPEMANMFKDSLDSTYKEEENVTSVEVKGQYIVIAFNEEEYKDKTLQNVKDTYSYLEEITNNN